MKLEGKRIVITGATTGIGREIVCQLHLGNQISVVGRPSPRLEKLREEFELLKIYEADLADHRSVENAADALVRDSDKIDILINNAAVQFTPQFLDDDFRFESIRREIDINFTSVCTFIYLLLPSLLKPSPSMILNVNSGLAMVPKTSSAIYCGTKGALNIFSQSLGHQLEGTNIKVKQAFLPLVDTAMTKGRDGNKLTTEQVVSEIIKGMGKSTPNIDVGKVKLLRILQRLSPAITQRIMKAS